MKINKSFLAIFLTFLSTFFINHLFALPPAAPSGPGCWPPPCMPIDGGISFLIAAGVAYGGKKVLNHRKKKEELNKSE